MNASTTTQRTHNLRSLRVTITLIVLAIILATFSIFFAIDISLRTHDLYTDQQEKLHVTTHRLANMLWVPVYDYNRPQIAKFLETEMIDHDVHAIVVHDAIDGNMLSGKVKIDNKIVDLNGQVDLKPYRKESAQIIRFADPLGKVTVYFTDETLLNRLWNDAISGLIEIIILGSAIVVALLLAITRFIIRPIRKMDNTFKQIMEGDLDIPIDTFRADEIGGLARSFAQMRDAIKGNLSELKNEIAERKRAESALQVQEENVRTTLNSIADAVIATDAEGIIRRMNPVAEQLTAWPSADAIGLPLQKVFHVLDSNDRSVQADPVQDILTHGSSYAFGGNALLINKDEAEFHIDHAATAIISDNNETLGIVLIFRDKTEEWTLQEQLRQSQKMDAVGQLAGGVAHDFNNMLGGIIGASEILGNYLKEDPKAEKYHKLILDTADRAAGLTRNLLTFARKSSLQFEVLNTHKIIEDTATLLKSSLDRRIEIRLALEAERFHISGDKSLLQSAILNLCINASHAMPDGGSISITTAVQTINAEQSIPNIEPGTYIAIDVKDTGSGISAEHLEHIFEPFFTTKETDKGTGLGLAAVFGTVQEHHGTISVESEIDAGTCFHILIPLDKNDSSTHNTTRTINHGEGCILLVDDEEMMRETGTMLLRSLGYQVLVAKNGNEALEIYNTQGEQIDLCILDMIMPELNGRDCYDAIKDINPSAKVILSSGYAQSDDITALLEKGLEGFLRKPYRAAELSAAVAKALSNKA